MFTVQELYCNGCGKLFQTDFRRWNGRVCSAACWTELEWRRSLSILRVPYEPDPGRAQPCPNQTG